MPNRSARLAARISKATLTATPARLNQDLTTTNDIIEAASPLPRTSKRRGRPPKHLISNTDYTPLPSSPSTDSSTDTQQRRDKGKGTARASSDSIEEETRRIRSRSSRTDRKKRSASHEHEQTPTAHYVLDAKEPLEIRTCRHRATDPSSHSDTLNSTSPSSSSLSLSASSLTTIDPSSNEDSTATQSSHSVSTPSSFNTPTTHATQGSTGEQEEAYQTAPEELSTATPPPSTDRKHHSKLPVAVFKHISDQDQFYKDSIKHDDSSDDDGELIPTEKREPIVFKRPEHHLIKFREPTEQELINTVEYDMDEQDAQWLKLLNKERKKQKLGLITADFFEIMIDHIEKEWFNLVKDLPKKSSEEQAFPEDIQCAVCDDSECENSNAIVFCDGCNIAVHQDCYGIPYIPEGQWLCRKCMVSPEQPVSCIFCPNEGGAFKQTTENQWGHLVCAMWIPEVGVGNSVYMEPIDNVDMIPKSRWKLTCFICKKKKGKSACIQCDNKHCFAAFHVTCARWARLCMRMKLIHGHSGSSAATATTTTTSSHKNMNAVAAAKGLSLTPSHSAAQDLGAVVGDDNDADAYEAGGDNVVLKAYCDKHTPKDYRDEVDVDACVLAAQEWHTKHKTTMPRTRYVNETQQAETTPESDEDDDETDDEEDEYTDIEDAVEEHADNSEMDSDTDTKRRKRGRGDRKTKKRGRPKLSSIEHRRRRRHKRSHRRKRSRKGKLPASSKKKAALAHRHQYTSTDHDGAPVAPQYLIDSLKNLDFVKAATNLKKKSSIIEQICRYWSLKRQDRRGAPLLKRLHLEPWTASASELMETEVEKAHKAASLIALRADIERVRLLTEQVQKREKLKLDRLKKQRAYLDIILYPIGFIIQTVLEQLMDLDRKELFRYPVTPEIASDYYDIVETPMSFQDIIHKATQHQYMGLTEFKKDLDLIWKNCMAYNKKNTIYFKTAQRLQMIAEELLKKANAEYLGMHVNPLTGLLDIPIDQHLFSYGYREEDASVHSSGKQHREEPIETMTVERESTSDPDNSSRRSSKKRRAASMAVDDGKRTSSLSLKKRRITRSSAESNLNKRELRSRSIPIIPHNDENSTPLSSQLQPLKKTRGSSSKKDDKMDTNQSHPMTARSTRSGTRAVSAAPTFPSSLNSSRTNQKASTTTAVSKMTALLDEADSDRRSTKKRRLEEPTTRTELPTSSVATKTKTAVDTNSIDDHVATRSRIRTNSIPETSMKVTPKKEDTASTIRRTRSSLGKGTLKKKQEAATDEDNDEDLASTAEAEATEEALQPKQKKRTPKSRVTKKKDEDGTMFADPPNTTKLDYKDGSIVWAKVKSFPSHPAKIVDANIKKNKVPEKVIAVKPETFKSPVLVTFFKVIDSHRWGWVEKEDIHPFGDFETDVLMLQQAKKSKKKARIQEVRKGYAYACRLLKKDHETADAFVFQASSASPSSSAASKKQVNNM